jgi:hypothetical protein
MIECDASLLECEGQLQDLENLARPAAKIYRFMGANRGTQLQIENN